MSIMKVGEFVQYEPDSTDVDFPSQTLAALVVKSNGDGDCDLIVFHTEQNRVVYKINVIEAASPPEAGKWNIIA